jgi:hypothetical protein
VPSASRTGIRRAGEPLGTASTPRAHQQILADLGFARDVEALSGLGPRATAEFLADLGAAHLIRLPLETRLREYVEGFGPERLRLVGADRFPPCPLMVVPR